MSPTRLAASSLSADGLEPSPPLPAPENKLFYPALDGLRATAVLMVFSVHYLALPTAFNWGAAGVDLFFVLSGFLITGILYDSRNREHRFRIFYIRRTLRIFPLYYAVLLAGLLLYPVFQWQQHRALWLWPVYLGNYARLLWPAEYIPSGTVYEGLHSSLYNASYNLDHLWSLCVEEQFYLAWPCVVFLIKDRVRLRNLCIAAVVAMPALRLFCLHAFPARLIDLGLLYRTTPLRADSLLLGGALALALRGPEARTLQSSARYATVFLVAMFAILEVVSIHRYGHAIDPAFVVLYNPFAATLLALFAAAVLLLALDSRTAVYAFCANTHLRGLGQRSYGFYVYHLLLYSAFHEASLAICLHHRGAAHRLLPLVALLGTLAISWLSFRFFEAPILRLKDRFAG